MNLVFELQQNFDLSADDIAAGLARRAEEGCDIPRAIDKWLQQEAILPECVKKAAASWVIEFWLNERDQCEAARLLLVDKKYTRLLRDFTLVEVIALRNAVSKNAVSN